MLPPFLVAELRPAAYDVGVQLGPDPVVERRLLVLLERRPPDLAGPRGGVARPEPAAAGVRGALGHILAEVCAEMADGTWERMKACRADDCKFAFLDTAKNRSRAWCSMQSCGNRAKVAAYRERHTA